MNKPCKVWTGAIEKTGYGRLKVEGKMWMAHRYAYYQHFGEIDPDMVIDHICFNRACVEPSHLLEISRPENSRRHKPDCPCNGCNADAYALEVCFAGHDISRPELRTKPRRPGLRGDCKECTRARARESSRRARERKAAIRQ